MKVQCDVCGKAAAAVFCCADEAALCEPCDRRVHRANKLAGKHRRFSLLLPSSSSSSSSSSSPSSPSHPVCDVCQERRGFVFCQEDRAILCRDCDVPIHGANHLTMKHNRFLLTGVRLSSAPISSSSSSTEPEMVAAANNNSDHSNRSVPEKSQQNALLANDSVLCSSDISIDTSTFVAAAAAAAAPVASNSSTGGGSSISDYLIKMCPGWRLEDLLVDDNAAAADGFPKQTTMDEMLPFMEADLEGVGLEAVAEEFPIWVPHVPQVPPPELPAVPGGTAATAGVHYQPWIAAKDPNFTSLLHGAKAAGRGRWSDDAFTVPQIAPATSNPGNRPRQLSPWYL